MEWYDRRLQYPSVTCDECDKIEIEGGQYHIDRIWNPSVFIPNNQDPGSFDYDYYSANLVKITSDGHVWLRKRYFILKNFHTVYSFTVFHN